jgi:hypothetical protein
MARGSQQQLTMRASSWLASVVLLGACGGTTNDDLRSSVQQCELDTDADLCDGMPFATTTASATEAMATPVNGGITYYIDPPAPGKRGYVVFTPQATGTHTLYFGHEEPARVCREQALCKSQISSCGDLERAAQYALIENDPYVIELPPLSNNHPFVLHIVEPDLPPPPPPPTGGIKLGPRAYYPSTGTFPTDFAVGDLNGDGAVDVAISNPDDAGGALYVDVLRNNGSGAFAHAARVQTSAPRELVISDFDADSDADIAGIAADGQGPLPNFLLHNDGNFMFSKTTFTTPLQYKGTVSSGDFDEDGITDLVALYVPGEGETTSGFVIHKMPAGTVLAQKAEFGADASAAIAGDFNGDGHQDVLVGSNVAPRVRLWLGDGTGALAFDREVVLPVSQRVTKLVAFDLDVNAYTDFVAFGAGPENQGKEGAVVARGSATGFAMQYLPFASTGVAAGDFDHDGFIDLVAGVPNAAADPTLSWYRGTAAGFVYDSDVPGAFTTPYLVAADLNNDGLMDLVTYGFDVSTRGIFVFLGTP